MSTHEPIEWDDRKADFEAASTNRALPNSVRTGVSELLKAIEKFGDWSENARKDTVRGYHCESCMDAVLGPAERAESIACETLRRFLTDNATERDLLDSFAKCRRYYVERMAKGLPLHS